MLAAAAGLFEDPQGNSGGEVRIGLAKATDDDAVIEGVVWPLLAGAYSPAEGTGARSCLRSRSVMALGGGAPCSHRPPPTQRVGSRVARQTSDEGVGCVPNQSTVK